MKMLSHPSTLYLVVIISPFNKWGIAFMMYKPTSVVVHNYIIASIDYFTKWADVMPTYLNNEKIETLFMFNHIITRFAMPTTIITDHGSHFCNTMMTKLATLLRFGQEKSSPYCPKER